MKQKDLVFLSMCREVIARLEKNRSHYNCYRVITNQLNRIKLLFEIINSNQSERVTDSLISFNSQKNGILNDLINGVVKIALKAKAYAKINNLPGLMALVDVSKEELLQENEKEIILTCESILNHTGSIQNHLIEDFNLSEELVLKSSAYLVQIKQMLNVKDKLNLSDLLLAENIKENMFALRTAMGVLDDLIYGIIEDDEFILMYRNIRKKQPTG